MLESLVRKANGIRLETVKWCILSDNWVQKFIKPATARYSTKKQQQMPSTDVCNFSSFISVQYKTPDMGARFLASWNNPRIISGRFGIWHLILKLYKILCIKSVFLFFHAPVTIVSKIWPLCLHAFRYLGLLAKEYFPRFKGFLPLYIWWTFFLPWLLTWWSLG